MSLPSALPCWFKLAVINGPAKKLLTQIGAKKRHGKDARMFFSLISFFAPFSIFYNYVIPQAACHMPFHKLIPPFTLTAFEEPNMTSVSLVWNTNMAAVTSCENTLFNVVHDQVQTGQQKHLRTRKTAGAILSNLFLASVFCKTLCRV